MWADQGRIRAMTETPNARELREELTRELAIYRRLDELADRSLALLREGSGSAGLIPILEEKRALLAQVRQRCRAVEGRGDGELLAEMDRLTGEMEQLLRETIRKEEEVDLHLRGQGDLTIPMRWTHAFAIDPPPEGVRLASVG